MTIALKRTLLLVVGLCAALAAWVVAGATTGQKAHADATTTVHVKSSTLVTTAGTCSGQSITGGEFIINQLYSTPPASITVYFSDGSSQTVGLSFTAGKTAHYIGNWDSSMTVTDATAELPTGWSGQFVLSHYLCGSGGGSSSSSSSVPPSGSMTS